jgi:serine/threonine protein kinase/formylglycine-generating enzyme required for sulfatase activity
MSSYEPHNPNPSETTEPMTEVQTTEAMEASVELSIPDHVHQHDAAPKLPGYILTELMGEGAYGQAWRAWQIRTRKEVAVKIFLHRNGLDWIFLQREVERLTRLDRHPHIVSLLDVNLEGDPPYYVMDLIGGGSLQKFVNPDSPLLEKKATHWLEQICDAMSYVHAKGLIHCDLKPANILVDEQNNVRVVDFGQSRVFSESAASLGTLFYMAPEQAMLAQPGTPVQPDMRWDVYAIGATLYAMLTGKVPHADKEVNDELEKAPTLEDRLVRYRSLVENRTLADPSTASGRPIDPELSAMLMKCMATNPNQRYDSTSEILADLQALKEKRPVSPLAHSTSYRTKKFFQRNPFRIGLGVAAVLMVVSLFFLNSYRKDLRREEANLRQEEARNLLATFVNDAPEALEKFKKVDQSVIDFIAELSARYLDSPFYFRRQMGTLGGFRFAQEAFWNSVVNGAIKEHGEWLELARSDWPDLNEILTPLQRKAKSGKANEKYVAFCLIGQLVGPQIGTKAANLNDEAKRLGEAMPELHPDRREELLELCRQSIETASDPGVVSAAQWTAYRLGLSIPYQSAENIEVDPISGQTFVRIPAAKDFRPGSPAEEEGRDSDENRPVKGVSFPELWVSTTEVTIAQYAPFHRTLVDKLPDKEKNNVGNPINAWERQIKVLAEGDEDFVPTAEEYSITAVSTVTPMHAKQYCDWLAETSRQAGKSNQYRLLKETEWEYACRGGNQKAFCYGEDDTYLKYFAFAQAQSPEWNPVTQKKNPLYVVATKMPNRYGLFDMHGNFWEICDTIYRADYNDPEPVLDLNKIDMSKLPNVVQRGGANYLAPAACRSAKRNLMSPVMGGDRAGFRLVLVRGE